MVVRSRHRSRRPLAPLRAPQPLVAPQARFPLAPRKHRLPLSCSHLHRRRRHGCEWILTSELNFGSKKLVIRICNEGFDSGRRYMSCPYEGLNLCGYLRWMDDAWQGRSRVVIQKLADDNKKVQIAQIQKHEDWTNKTHNSRELQGYEIMHKRDQKKLK
ncbi:hypothetical protein ZWY2020_028092 [Hordeum vulgare]|nr:hypothetical protein ZWY2020_028092 [Hordeum vulgare]